MNPKLLLYMFVSFIVVLGVDSININHIFKKGKVFQARIFYFLLILALIYIITNFIYDVATIFPIS